VPTADLADEELAAAAAGLAESGAAVPDPSGDPLRCQIHPSVVADLAILAAPRVLVETQVRHAGDVVIAAHGLAGLLGAGLVHLGEGEVELSMFPVGALGDELVRLVPEIPRGTAAGPGKVVGLDVLEGAGAALEAGGTDLVWRLAGEQGWPWEEVAAALPLGVALAGSLRCLVVAPGNEVGGIGLGQVVWLATGEGWTGLLPEPGRTGTRPVRLVAVDRSDLAAWVAPLVAEAL
jgi:hypothetical protein